MHNETFYLDGVDARSVGIKLQRPVQFSEPVPDTEVIHVPGRNGDLTMFSGSYENRVGSADCYALGDGVTETVVGINNFLMGVQSYRKLTTSNDPNHYWMARVVNGARIDNRKDVLNPFEIEFDCKPQRYLVDGNYILSYALPSGEVMPNPTQFDAKPLISIYGSGEGQLIIAGETITISEIGEYVTIDCDTMNAYNGPVNRNSSVTMSGWPKLPPDTVSYEFSGGITRIEITPRWWTL